MQDNNYESFGAAADEEQSVVETPLEEEIPAVAVEEPAIAQESDQEEAAEVPVIAEETNQEAEAEEPVTTEEAVISPAVEEPKKKKKGKGVLIAVVAVVLAAALGVGGWFGFKYWQNTKNYEQAVSLVAAKEYDKALAQFKSLGDFKDSAAQVSELTEQQADYDAAKALLEEKKLTEAKDAFAALGTYRDCPELVLYTDAKLAMRSAKKPREYVDAAEMFEALGDLEDSKAMVSECYLKAAYAAVDDSKDPQQYLDKLTEEQIKQFEETFHDEEVLKGWEEALTVRYEMETDEEKQGFDFSEELDILEPLVEYECTDQALEDLLEDYYDTVQEQGWNLDKDGYVFDWVEHYELELKRSEILTEMYEEFGFLAENQELCDWYVNMEDYFEACVEIETSLNEWYDQLELQEANGRAYIQYTNDTDYDFTLSVGFYYYDDQDELIGTEDQMGSLRSGETLRFYMDIPRDMETWNIGFYYEPYQELDMQIGT